MLLLNVFLFTRLPAAVSLYDTVPVGKLPEKFLWTEREKVFFTYSQPFYHKGQNSGGGGGTFLKFQVLASLVTETECAEPTTCMKPSVSPPALLALTESGWLITDLRLISRNHTERYWTKYKID